MTRLRHVAAFVLLGPCFAVAGWWIRSYSSYDSVCYRSMQDDNHFCFSSLTGLVRCEFLKFDPAVHSSDGMHWWWQAMPSAERDSLNLAHGVRIRPAPEFLGFTRRDSVEHWSLGVPYWFLALLTAASAFAVRPPPRSRFSLGQSLIAVTIAAAVFGLILGTIRREPVLFELVRYDAMGFANRIIRLPHVAAFVLLALPIHSSLPRQRSSSCTSTVAAS